jgi:DeoR/GlpR family transcriptional regulator of sugar metabolism
MHRPVGGIRDRPRGDHLRSVSQSFVGPLAEAALERMSFDRVFPGRRRRHRRGWHLRGRPRPDAAQGAHGRRGREVYVLAGSSMLGLRPFHAWARLALPWTLVTDYGAAPGQVQKFRDAGVQVEVAEVS